MKKFLSALLAAVLLAACWVVPASADIPADYVVANKQTNVEVQALVFKEMPNFDGDLSEWGDATVTVNGTDALKTWKRAGDGDTRPAPTDYSPKNTLFYNNGSYNNTATADGQMEYKLWFRWDNDNFYVAASVVDPDGYVCTKSRDNLWSEDVLQMYVDIVGVNSAMSVRDPSYNYKTTGLDLNAADAAPWFSKNVVPNLTIGYCSTLRTSAYQLYNGHAKKMIASANNKMERETKTGYDEAGYIAIKPAEAAGGTTYFEMAIPWSTLNYMEDENYVHSVNENNQSRVIYVGKAIGVSTCMFNTAPGGNQNFYGCWGSGVIGVMKEWRDECSIYTYGGANAVVLSDKGIDGSTVDGLLTKDESKVEVPYANQVLYADSSDNNFNSDDTVTGSNYIIEADLAFVDYNVMDEETTSIAFSFGSKIVTDEDQIKKGNLISEFTYMAGYDFYTQTFVIGNMSFGGGFKPDAATDTTAAGSNILARSDKFEWKRGDAAAETPVAAEWHKIALKVEGDTATVYCDGEEMVKWTDPTVNWKYAYEEVAKTNSDFKAGHSDWRDEYHVLFYGTAARLIDNWVFTEDLSYQIGSGKTDGLTDLKHNFNFDTTDDIWYKSATYVGFPGFETIPFVCNDAEQVGLTGHNMTKVVAANADKVVYGCQYCDHEAEKAVDNVYGYAEVNPEHEKLDAGDVDVYLGDVDGDNELTMKDVVMVIQVRAELRDAATINMAAADLDADGSLTMKDVVMLIQIRAGLRDNPNEAA